jgi:hypothetical protein
MPMKKLPYVFFTLSIVCAPASGGPILFDFNSGPQYRSVPLDLTVDGFTAHFSATGQGYSIQDTAQVIGVLPTGFSGLGLVPNSIFASDLLVSFPNEKVTAFSILVAPQELATDTTATLRVTAYENGTFVGTNTSTASGDTFTWPSSTLSFSSPQGFNSVVVHYDSAPPTGGDYGVIFVADNMIVTPAAAAAVPEPSGLFLFAMGVLGLLYCRRHIHAGWQQDAVRDDSLLRCSL